MSRKREDKPLNERQLAFVEAYLADPDRSARAAAEKAGYSNSVAKNATQYLLRKPHIAKYVHDQLTPVMERLDITVERTVRELAAVGMVDPIEAIVPKSKRDTMGLSKWMFIKDPEDIPENVRRAIKKIRSKTDGGFEIEFHPKLEALSALLKLLMAGPEDDTAQHDRPIINIHLDGKDGKASSPNDFEVEIVNPLPRLTDG